MAVIKYKDPTTNEFVSLSQLSFNVMSNYNDLNNIPQINGIVLSGNMNSASLGLEPKILAGTNAQYYRGDKTWQTLDKNAIQLNNVPNVDATNPENIIQTTYYRFVTDTEKAAWNLKESAITKNTAFNRNFETATTNIKINGISSVGSLDTIARADHVHPSDTTKANITHTHTVSDISNFPSIPNAVTVDDNLLSSSTTNALSAKQGCVLSTKIGDIDTILDAINGEII